MPYKKAVIYFWSGTGNSYRVSTWMGNTARENGLNARVLSIDKKDPKERLKGGNEDLIGIVFPTHGFTAPWHILKFVWNLPHGDATRAFCVATRAGLKIGSVFIPGISGSATFIIALILMCKGYSVRGSMSVDMPSNWFSLHPIQGRKSHEAIIRRAEGKVACFMERILSDNKVWISINNLYEVIWGFLLSLVSVAYLFMGRFFLAKLFFANKNCDGCGGCARYCSVKAIKMRGKETPRPFWRYNCESCMRCAAICPKSAIEAGHSWGVILYFISAVPIFSYFLSWFDIYIFDTGNIKDHWISYVFNLIYFYPAIFISYFIFDALIRIPAVNWIFSNTTMTHLSFWGRYLEPNTKFNKIAEMNKKVDSRSKQKPACSKNMG